MFEQAKLWLASMQSYFLRRFCSSLLVKIPASGNPYIPWIILQYKTILDLFFSWYMSMNSWDKVNWIFRVPVLFQWGRNVSLWCLGYVYIPKFTFCKSKLLQIAQDLNPSPRHHSKEHPRVSISSYY